MTSSDKIFHFYVAKVQGNKPSSSPSLPQPLIYKEKGICVARVLLLNSSWCALPGAGAPVFTKKGISDVFYVHHSNRHDLELQETELLNFRLCLGGGWLFS